MPNLQRGHYEKEGGHYNEEGGQMHKRTLWKGGLMHEEDKWKRGITGGPMHKKEIINGRVDAQGEQ